MFTFRDYESILRILKDAGFEFSSFESYSKIGKVFLRHDVDVFMENSLKLARIESDLGITATYMIMVDSEFYNPLSHSSMKIIEKLSNMGHVIGLHLDTRNMKADSKEAIKEYAEEVYDFYSRFLPLSRVISFHRPVVEDLKEKELDGFINVYHKKFFEDIRYFSDSKMRNFLPDLVESLKDDKDTSIQLLIHPLWWEHTENDILEAAERYLKIKGIFLKKSFTRELNVFKEIIDGRFFGELEV